MAGVPRPTPRVRAPAPLGAAPLSERPPLRGLGLVRARKLGAAISLVAGVALSALAWLASPVLGESGGLIAAGLGVALVVTGALLARRAFRDGRREIEQKEIEDFATR